MKTTTIISAVVAVTPLLAAVHPAGARQLGTVVCVASEFETPVTDATDSIQAVLKGMEPAARVGVALEGLEEAEQTLRAELGADGDVWCARSGPEHTHLVVVSYTGVVRQGLRLQRFPDSPADSVRMRPADVFQDCEACPKMVVVPTGSFMMGSPASEDGRDDAERPQHRVTIDAPFAVGVYEVTFAEWDVCVQAGGCGGYRPGDEGWGRESLPVMKVSWEDAQGYVQWLSQETGARYRLLTEAEWEYVARAGTQTARYWGARESGQCRYGNGADAAARREFPDVDASNFTGCSDGYVYNAPVGSFQPNAFGLYDMLGNVWEWTEDCWNGDYSGAPANGSAWGSGDCSQRVLRGGSWSTMPGSLRSAFRFGTSPGVRNRDLGFRVARTMN